MNTHNILITQLSVFNDLNSLSSNEFDNVINNKYLIYDVITHIDFSINNTYLLKDIIWLYDKNNIRTPYYNNTKIQYINFTNNMNIYDYISSNSLIENEELISGESLQYLADIVLCESQQRIYSNPNNNSFSKKIALIDELSEKDIKDYKIIFVFVDGIRKFYDKFNNLEDKIVMTHNGDTEFTNNELQYLNKVKHHYAQNCLVKHDKLTSLPIGIENRQWFDHNLIHDARIRTDIVKTKNVYFLFSLNTHPSRRKCYKKLKDKLQWNNMVQKHEYFIELKRHKYAICPRGNGLDTHRLWECFYLDVIPIVIESDFVKIVGLPMIILKSWDDFDESNLLTEFENISNCKITMSYYKKLLEEKI
jgi:hypothetical protein